MIHRGARKARPIIPGMTLVGERPHNKYRSASFIRDDLKVISVTAANHVEVITAKLSDVVVHSVYKPHTDCPAILPCTFPSVFGLILLFLQKFYFFLFWLVACCFKIKSFLVRL